MAGSIIKSEPLVSFIIAAYNEERFIEECLDSCLNQTYPNIEVSITDDGSTDGTWDILAGYYKNDSRVLLDRFEKNRGKILAFNNSYKRSNGDFIAVIGADDVSFPDRIEKSIHFMKKHRFDLIFGKPFYCDINLAPLNYGPRKFKRNHTQLARIIVDNTCSGPTLFIKRPMAERCFPIPEDLKFEDWWIAFIAILYGKAGFLNEYLTKYRQHGDNDNSAIDDSQIIPRLRRDFFRHGEYYRCFHRELSKNEGLRHRERYLKRIRLNALHRKIFMMDRFIERIKSLPELARNIVFSHIFIISLFLIFFGNRIYNIKRLKIYRRFFHYPDRP